MTIWVDAQVSPAVAHWLSAKFGVSASAVRELGLRDAKDSVIFERARLAGAVVLTKDSDLVELLRRQGPPSTVLWLTMGNTTNERLRQLLEAAWPRILENLARGEGLIELTNRIEAR